ncbi:HD-GYP domain-containing protein [Deferribacter abyssi]|uniref:HD-GYP domain-containing protein n=1 Tax=Deferribacter abyssi TaxID=213806 RepID=UPI003C234DC0
MRKVEIKISELEKGDRIIELVGFSWLDTTFIKHKFVIKDEKHLCKTKGKLKKNGVKKVVVERKKSYQSEKDYQIKEQDINIEENFISKKEISDISSVYDRALEITKSLLNDVRAGKLLNLKKVKLITKELSDLILKKGALLCSITKLKSYDDYTFHHSLNVSIFAGSLAVNLKKNEEFTHKVTLSALLHDIGKMKISNTILNKPGKLTNYEFEIMKKHVEYGCDYLKHIGLSDEEIKICYEHHERAGGTGYPRGLKDAEISIEGKIGAVVDVYDALTSERVYKPRISPAKALKMMMGWADNHFNKEVLKFFIRNTGIYPVGTIVLLNTGEIGIIAKVNIQKLTLPMVVIFINSKGGEIPEFMVDLSKQNLQLRKIVGVLDPKKVKIPCKVLELIEENLK